MWAVQYHDFVAPRTFHTSVIMGTLGFGLPAAIGAHLANPGKLVIDVDGDGSIRMNLGELETLTTYDIPVKVLLLNNLGDGMVRQWQALFYSQRYSGSDKTLHKKDFVKAVEADGFQFAQRVAEIDDVRPRLESFVAFPGPAFLEVMIDQNAHVYPMVAPGATATLVWSHGNGGNIAGRADVFLALAARGVAVLAYDYRGYGRSEGRPSEPGVYLDVEAAYDSLRARGVPARQIVAFGESL